MPKLGVIVASVRQGRNGKGVADWLVEAAQRQGGFAVEMLDLKEFNLPVLEEPQHPIKQEYHDERVRRWAAAVAGCDAFVIVTPEYNFNSPPALINALDHLYKEWNYKPAGFVSYGGMSGGIRSVQASKVLLTTLKMVPLVEAVALQFDGQGKLTPGEAHEKAAGAMLQELSRWTAALATLR